MRPLLVIALLVLPAFSQTTIQPDCAFTATLSSTTPSSNIGNLGNACTNWSMAYYQTGLSALSVQLEGAPDNGGTPGSFTALGSVLIGANPMTATAGGYMVTNAYAAWLRVHATVFTGTGTITVKVYGWRYPLQSSSGGGGGGGNANITQVDGVTAASDGAGVLIGSPCNNPLTLTNVFTPLSTTGAQQIIPGTAGKKTYLCKRYVSTTNPENFTWTSATAGSCGGTTATVDQQLNAIAAMLDDNGSIVVGTGLNVCINPSVSQAAALLVSYVQF